MIHVVLTRRVGRFSKYAFKVNWAPGKTEGMLVYRGKYAMHARDRRRLDGKTMIKFPEVAGASYLNFVKPNEHLGSYIADDGHLGEDAKHRARSANAAYIPLAAKLFAATRVAVDVRLSFADSLVFARLFYNTHLWQAENKQALRTLNNVYMRTLRAIAGRSRFRAGCGTDYDIRWDLGRPCIECVLAQNRLLYMAKVVQQAPPSIDALLQLQQPYTSTRLPCVDLLIKVPRNLKMLHAKLLADVPDPCDDAKHGPIS